MTFSFAWVFIAILFIVLVAGIIYLLMLWLKEDNDRKDNPLYINFNSMLDNTGIFIISETEKQQAVDNRFIIKGFAKTADLEKLKAEGKKYEEVETIVEQQNLLIYPKGNLDKYKNIEIGLPSRPELLPEKIKNTPIGKMFAALIEKNQVDKEILQIVRSASDLKTEYLKKMPEGEVSDRLINTYDSIFKQLENLIKAKQTTTSIIDNDKRQQ